MRDFNYAKIRDTYYEEKCLEYTIFPATVFDLFTYIYIFIKYLLVLTPVCWLMFQCAQHTNRNIGNISKCPRYCIVLIQLY